MIMNFKKFIIFFGTLAIINFISPSLLFARETPISIKFCERLNEIILRIDKRFIDESIKLQKKYREERLNNLEKRRSMRNNHRLENRNLRNDNRQEHYRKLEERALSDTQKQAVITFKATIEKAISARKFIIDETIETFEKDIDAVIALRNIAIDSAINDFKNTKITAINKAKTDCLAGIDSKIVRETFQTEMNKAQNKFKNDQQEIEELKNLLYSINIERKKKIERAIINFKAVVEKERIGLEKAFE